MPTGLDGTGTWSYSLITQGDATVLSHANYRGFAIGGSLEDGTPTAQGTTVGSQCFQPAGAIEFVSMNCHSWVNNNSAGANFNYATGGWGVTFGQGNNFDWNVWLQ